MSKESGHIFPTGGGKDTSRLTPSAIRLETSGERHFFQVVELGLPEGLADHTDLKCGGEAAYNARLASIEAAYAVGEQGARARAIKAIPRLACEQCIAKPHCKIGKAK